MTEEERYAKVEQDRQNAINQSNQVYNDLISGNTALAQQQKDYINTWQNTQNEIADKNAAYQVELQNQNKEKAQKEFEREAIASKNAYYDFINPYGANAEIQAQNGLNNTGYSETTKLGAWNINQNRTAQARATMNNAKQQYDNAIKEIELNRDTTKSQYALQALQQQLEAAVNEFNTSSQLRQSQLSNTQALDSEYNDRYNTVWQQINTEKEQAEAIRQYEQNYALQKQQFQEDIRQFDVNIAYLKAKDAKEYELEIKKLEEQKRQAQQEQKNWEKEYQLSLKSLKSSGSSGTKSSGGSKKSSGSKSSVGALTESLPADYYFKNGYQPQYVDGKKLSGSGLKVKDVFTNAPVSGSQNVWSANGRYYVWIGNGNNSGQYVDVTSQVNQSKKKKMCVSW